MTHFDVHTKSQAQCWVHEAHALPMLATVSCAPFGPLDSIVTGNPLLLVGRKEKKILY